MSSMKKNIRILQVLFLIIISTISNVIADDKEQIDLKSAEDSLSFYFSKIATEQDDFVKENLNKKILQYFRSALNNEESFDYKFDSLKYVGIIKSDDEKLRIITWNLPYNDRTHKYFGFIQYKESKKSVVTTELHDKSDGHPPSLELFRPDL